MIETQPNSRLNPLLRITAFQMIVEALLRSTSMKIFLAGDHQFYNEVSEFVTPIVEPKSLAKYHRGG